VAAVLLGAGTAMVYPTLLAVVGDVAHPVWRAQAVGTYRLWRDGGFAVGALLAGFLADLYSVRVAIWAVAAVTAASGLLAAARLYETHASPRTHGTHRRPPGQGQQGREASRTIWRVGDSSVQLRSGAMKKIE
jgi:MFS family permease